VGLVAAAITALAIAEPYRLQRLTAFVDPFKQAEGAGYHAVEGIYALANGGIFGVGLGQGTSKYGWVPNANSDYVFSIIGEELGLVGCLAVLALFALFAFTGMRIARRSADPFVRLAAGGATVWLCGQAVINIGYVTALLPVTGIPLPFISAGGTSLLASFFVLGMMLSFARHEAPAVAATRRAERLGRRPRVQRWLRIPVPRPYQPPKRRSQAGGQRRNPAPAPEPVPLRAQPRGPRMPAAPAAQLHRTTSRTGSSRNQKTALRATGTDARRAR
jgi:cell division protein FtsW